MLNTNTCHLLGLQKQIILVLGRPQKMVCVVVKYSDTCSVRTREAPKAAWEDLLEDSNSWAGSCRVKRLVKKRRQVDVVREQGSVSSLETVERLHIPYAHSSAWLRHIWSLQIGDGWERVRLWKTLIHNTV